MPAALDEPILLSMNSSYAVTWCNGTRRQATGRLELGRDAIELVGTVNGEAVREEIPYRELLSVAVGRSAEERIDGRQTVVVNRVEGTPLRIAGVTQGWVVSELVDRLAALQISAA